MGGRSNVSRFAGPTWSATSDVFGKMFNSVDFGNHTTDFTFNLAGLLSHQSYSAGRSLDYSYTVTDLVSAITKCHPLELSLWLWPKTHGIMSRAPRSIRPIGT